MQYSFERPSLFPFLCLTIAQFLLLSCTPSKQYSHIASSSGNNSFAVIPPPITTLPVTEKPMIPLSWEKSRPQAVLWSKYLYSVIEMEEPQLLAADAALDTDLFCPRFKEMTENQRLNFWGELFSAMAKYESSWNPTSRYVETTMGIDPITGQQVASEGLLQLSYQDVPNLHGVCEFDWNKDKSKSLTDATRTILDPFKNLRCGIKIMALIIKRRDVIATETGAYWAVIKKNGSHHRIDEISKMTKSLNFCLTAN